MPRGAKPVFTPAQDQGIAALYAAGKSTYEIARHYGTSPRPVTAALQRQGIQLRTREDYNWKPTPENRAEILGLREEGLSVQQIARRVGTGNSVVSQTLHDEGIPARFGGLNRRFKGAQVQELASAYQAGASLNDLARANDCSNTVIANTLTRAGVQLRPKGVKFWTPARLQQVREMHLQGFSQEEIAQALSVSQPLIGHRLRRLGLEPNHGPGFRRETHPSWNGGRTLTEDGYVRVKLPDADRHLFPDAPASDYVLEHRLVMARHLGRPLYDDENVHHKRGKAENDLEHLELWTTSQPSGQRVEDVVEWAAEMLRRYAPERLKAT